MQAVNWIFIIVLTLVTGWFDSRGFIHAANIWDKGQINSHELGLSAIGFGLGIVAYWISIRFMGSVGVVSPEIQSLIWFSAVIIGIAITSGKFLNWQRPEQIVAILVILGIGWLIVKTGG